MAWLILLAIVVLVVALLFEIALAILAVTSRDHLIDQEADEWNKRKLSEMDEAASKALGG